MVMLGASNLRQQRRLWTVLGRRDMIKRTNEKREADREREVEMLAEIMLSAPPKNGKSSCRRAMCRLRACGRWEKPSRSAARDPRHHSPPCRSRRDRWWIVCATGGLHFAHGGPRIDTPPPTLGQHNDKILPDDVRNENVRTLSKLPDSAQGLVSQSDAQRIKDAAYEEYAANLRNDIFRSVFQAASRSSSDFEYSSTIRA
jgi:hypothetical protein